MKSASKLFWVSNISIRNNILKEKEKIYMIKTKLGEISWIETNIKTSSIKLQHKPKKSYTVGFEILLILLTHL